MKVEFHTTLGSIAGWTGGVLLSGDPDTAVNSITTDSREPGKDSLFVPLIGKKFDGHEFIEELAKNKSIAAYMTMKKETPYGFPGVGAVLCDDTLRAYGSIASNHRNRMNASIIAITGTNGKTTTKEMIWSVLNRKQAALKNEKNYNNEIGVPYTLLGLRKEHKWAVIEMGMNHKREIDTLSRMAQPDIALITNIGEGHLEFLGSIDNVALAKSEIMHGMKQGSLIILNMDTQCFDVLSKKASDMDLKIKTFGLSKDADVRPGIYKMSGDSIHLEYNGDIFDAPVYGLHNIYNAIAAIAVAETLGIESDIIKEALLNFKSVDMRSQIIKKGFTVINDTYNSNPLSARYALKSMQEVFPGNRKVAVFSDMKELGDSAEYYHLDIGKLVYASGIDLLFTWGELAEKIAIGARKSGMKDNHVLQFKDKNELIDNIFKRIAHDDVILVKGSRSMKMEEVVEAIIH